MLFLIDLLNLLSNLLSRDGISNVAKEWLIYFSGWPSSFLKGKVSSALDVPWLWWDPPGVHSQCPQLHHLYSLPQAKLGSGTIQMYICRLFSIMFSIRTQVPLLPLALYSYWLSSQFGWPVKFKWKNNCNGSFWCHFYLYQLHVPLVWGPYQGMSRGRPDTIVSFLFRAVLWHSSTRCPAGSSCTTLTVLWGSLSVILSPDTLYPEKITRPLVSPRPDLCSALYGSAN